MRRVEEKRETNSVIVECRRSLQSINQKLIRLFLNNDFQAMQAKLRLKRLPLTR